MSRLQPDADYPSERRPETAAAEGRDHAQVQSRMSSAPTALFDRRLLRGLVPILGGGLLVTLFFLVFGTETDTITSAGTDSFSRSAIGHHALITFLEETGTRVLVSRQASASKALDDVPLLILEPPQAGSFERFQLVLQTTHRQDRPVVVVLPKWQGEAQERRPEWIAETTLLPKRGAARVLAAVFEALDRAVPSLSPAANPEGNEDSGADDEPDRGPMLSALLHRPAEVTDWRSLNNRSLPVDAIAPSLPRPQLAAEGVLEAIVTSAQGTLAGWIPDTRILVITDPDLLNTAGLARGDNALLAHALLVDSFDARAFVVDEVLHGFGVSASFARALLRFPFVCLSLHALLIAVLLLWRAIGRFGNPLPSRSRLARGKATLIDNTASLIAMGERGSVSLRRYLEAMLRRAVRQAQLQTTGSIQEQAEALSRLASARGTRDDICKLADRATASGADRRAILPLARDIHTWFEEMFHGAHRASRRR